MQRIAISKKEIQKCQLHSLFSQCTRQSTSNTRKSTTKLTGNHRKREKHNQKKCSTLFSAPNRTQEQRNREGGRERNRERAKARALFTQVCLEKTAQKAQAKKKINTTRKKNRHEKEQVEKYTKKMRKIPRHSRQRGMRRVESGQLRLVLRSEVARQLYLLCTDTFHCFQRFRFGFHLNQRCLCCCGRDCNCDCSSARVGGNYAMPTLRSCHRTSWPGRQQSRAGPGRAIAEYFVHQNSCSFSAAE